MAPEPVVACPFPAFRTSSVSPEEVAKLVPGLDFSISNGDVNRTLAAPLSSLRARMKGTGPTGCCHRQR